MNRLEKIRSKYPGHYIKKPNQLKYVKGRGKALNKAKAPETSLNSSRDSVIAYANTIQSLESNIDKMLGLLL